MSKLFQSRLWATEAAHAFSASIVGAHKVLRDYRDKPAEVGDLIKIDAPASAENLGSLTTGLGGYMYVEQSFQCSDTVKSFEFLRDTYITPAMRDLGHLIDRLILERAYCAVMGSVLRKQCRPALTRETVEQALEEASLALSQKSRNTLMCGVVSETELLFSGHSLIDLFGDAHFEFFLDSNMDAICKGSSVAWAPNSLALVTRPLKSPRVPESASTAVADFNGVGLQVSTWERDKRLNVRYEMLASVMVLDPSKIIVFQD